MATVPQTLTGFFTRQLRFLSQAGFEVHAVSTPGAELDDLGAACGITTHGVPMERRPSPVKDTVSLARIIALMRRLRPHIVHAHTPKAGLLGMAAARLAGVKLCLYTVHGLPLLTRTGPWRKVLEFAEWSSLRMANGRYVVSESLRDLMLELELCRPGDVKVLGNGSCAGVDVDRFRIPEGTETGVRMRRRAGVPEDAVLSVFVGRLARDKGVGVLSEAWRKVSARLPQLHLLMAGEHDGTDPVPAEAMAALANDPRVHLIGSVARADMPAVYAAADFCVLPTFREGLTQVALECGAAGRAMLATRIPGVLGAVDDGRTGLLVEAGAAQPLAEAMERLASDGALRARLGAAAAEHIRERFSEQRVNELWLAEYARLAAECLPQTMIAGTRAEHTY
ncbi:MAG: glycosyltransferase family 4 protein [Acidobacteria bacterium]|nr:glycosyltransferase family 4 protein [Acidobacteriota bacterium]